MQFGTLLFYSDAAIAVSVVGEEIGDVGDKYVYVNATETLIRGNKNHIYF